MAYALGSGKAVISTPYWYAEELLANGRGVLVPWRDSKAIAKHAIELLTNETARRAMQNRAAAYTCNMAWPNVARRYVQSFEMAAQAYQERQSSRIGERSRSTGHAEFETLNLVRQGTRGLAAAE